MGKVSGRELKVADVVAAVSGGREVLTEDEPDNAPDEPWFRVGVPKAPHPDS